MPDERRYGEREVKEIFDRASRPGGVERSDSVDEAGLTLAELQEVGLEVGLEPVRIAAAAAALEGTSTTLPSRRLFGMPVSVGRVVELPRAPTDHEWELLVAELRATFGAKGKVASSGGLREWSNGNLHALIEPTQDGYRLRMSTVKGSALAMRRAGVFGLVFSLFLATILSVQGRVDELIGPAVFALASGAALASVVLTLPSWARERTRQMEQLAERVPALISAEPHTGE